MVYGVHYLNSALKAEQRAIICFNELADGFHTFLKEIKKQYCCRFSLPAEISI
jgi:hypothetical protein